MNEYETNGKKYGFALSSRGKVALLEKPEFDGGPYDTDYWAYGLCKDGTKVCLWWSSEPQRIEQGVYECAGVIERNQYVDSSQGNNQAR